jgi:uncharacterized membrane protein YphA (DoxX/SURF4 family)
MKQTSLPPSWFARLFVTSPIYWVALLGLCAAYLQGGLVKATDFSGAVAELGHFGLPVSPWLVLGTIFTELVGSILILTNCYRWLGALLLAGFTLTATFVANRFWEIPTPDRFMIENAFFEHLGLVGGFLLVAWYDIRDAFQK